MDATTFDGRRRRTNPRVVTALVVASLLAASLFSTPAGAQPDLGPVAPIDAPELRHPTGLAAAPDGSLVIGDLMGPPVHVLPSPDGTALPLAGYNGSLVGGVAAATDGTVHIGGSVFAPSGGINSIHSYAPGSTTPTVRWLPEVGNMILGLAALPGGDLVFTTGAEDLYRLPRGSSQPTLMGTTGLAEPFAVAAAPDGALLVTDSTLQQVLRIPAGSTTASIVPIDGLVAPNGVAVDRAGAVYVADNGAQRVLRVDPHTGAVQDLGFPVLDSLMASVAVSPRGDVYVGYPFRREVLRLPVEARVAASGPYVDAVYQVLLGRPADPGGRDHHAQRLVAGIAPDVVTAAIARSPEARRRTVDDLYRRILGRPADPSGLAHWSAELLRGARPDHLAATLLASAEVRNRLPSNRAFVLGLYRVGLDRDGSADAGTAHWVARLDAGTGRAAVARSILGSAEAVRLQIHRSHDAVLGRPPSAEELTAARRAWSSHGHDPVRFAATLLASREALEAPRG